MSVLVVVKVSGNTDMFQKALEGRAEYLVAIDEWETAEGFQEFFGDPKMQEFVGSIGADPAPPEITISEAISAPDEF